MKPGWKIVQAGLSTPYEMMAKADVSLGSSLPALNRLVEAGLLSVSRGNPRRKKMFKTKEAASGLLAREWQNRRPSRKKT